MLNRSIFAILSTFDSSSQRLNGQPEAAAFPICPAAIVISMTASIASIMAAGH
jgi:hypothetical protein